MTTTLKLNDVLTKLMVENSVDDSLLSKDTGVPISTIKRMRLNENSNPTATTLAPIAAYFGITIDQLLGLSSINEQIQDSRQLRIVPILTKDTISLWLENKLEDNKIEYWAKASLEDKKCYAIRYESFTNDRKGNNRNIVIVSPSMNPLPGDLIIISNKEFNNPTLFELHQNEEQYFISLLDKPNDLISLKLPFNFYGVASEIYYHTDIEERNLISDGLVLAPFMLKCE